jgi:hypothetical protein
MSFRRFIDLAAATLPTRPGIAAANSMSSLNIRFRHRCLRSVEFQPPDFTWLSRLLQLSK